MAGLFGLAGGLFKKAFGWLAVANKEIATLGKLTNIGANTWESTAGLVYGSDKKFGNRIMHILAHLTPNSTKKSQTVFNVTRNKLLGLIDEAWGLRGMPMPNDNGAFIVKMGRIIGTNGETSIKIIVQPGTSNIITAYPIK